MRVARSSLLLATTILLFLHGATCADEDELPLGLAPLSPNHYPPEGPEVGLGEKLFFDKNLSRDGTVSCATCHIPEEAFAQRGAVTSKGIDGQLGRRNSPSLLNVTFARKLFLDGRSDSLEDQAWQPILASDEMGNKTEKEVLDRLAKSKHYTQEFKKSFGIDRPDKASVAKALASYQRTLVSGNSPFDQWNWAGEEDAISPQAIRGFDLFAGQALCWQCHSLGGDDGVTLTDQQFHNTGVGWLGEQRRKKGGSEVKEDFGRFETTKNERDRWQYKTPSLRNVALTAPYMHDGSIATLKEVVEFYNLGGGDGATQPLYLEEAEIGAIVAFLEALTGDQSFESPKNE